MSRHRTDVCGLNVLRRQNGKDSFRLACLVGLYSHDTGVCVLRTHEGGVDCIGQPWVVHEAAGSAHKGVVLDARR